MYSFVLIHMSLESLDLYFGCLELYLDVWTCTWVSGLVFRVSGLVFWLSGAAFWFYYTAAIS